MFRSLLGFWTWNSAMAFERDPLIPREDNIDPVDEFDGFDGKDLDYILNGGHYDGLELFKPKWGLFGSWLPW